MLARFQRQTEQNKQLLRKETTYKKDVTYSDGARATYEFDLEKKDYKETPSEIIIK